MKENTIYLNAAQNVSITHKRVLMEDAVTLYGQDKEMIKKLNHMVLYQITQEKERKYVFSILKIMEQIHKQYPSLMLEIIGEMEFVVSYAPPRPEKRWLVILKTIAVCVIVFTGAAFAIMTFNTDVSVGDVFDRLYRLIMGRTKDGTSVIEVSYAIGLFLGIMVFYNHFSVHSSQIDPTPIQVEMRKYEKEVNDSVIQTAGREGKVMDVNG